jgi:drug/metabolite transporter (DMT)-like permease
MISTYRLVISSLILLAVCRVKKISLAGYDKKTYFWGMLVGLFLSLHFITWITSLKYTSVASSVVLVDTNPIFVAILSYLFLKERHTGKLIFAIFLSVIGASLIAAGDSGFQNLIIRNKKALIGDMLAICGAISGSAYLVIGSKLRKKLDILTYITIVYTFSAIFLLIISLAMKSGFTGYKTASYIFMVLLAIVPQLLGHSSFNWALKHLNPTFVSITILGEPICASFLAFLIFNEHIGSIQLLGIASIFAAIIIGSSYRSAQIK